MDRSGAWPVHYACCRPVWGPKQPYCEDHFRLFFNAPELVGRNLYRSLRKHTE